MAARSAGTPGGWGEERRALSSSLRTSRIRRAQVEKGKCSVSTALVEKS